MLPIPETRFWSSSARLIPVRLARSRATAAARSNSGSNGSRPMCATSSGSSAPPGERDRPPNIRWSTKRSPGSPSANRNSTRVFGTNGAATGSSRNWPLMPRWARTASPSGSSGTGSARGYGAVAARGLEGREGHGRRVLLGFLLVAAGTGAVALVVDLHRRREGLGVVRSGLDHLVSRYAESGDRRDLLQARLPVQT